MTLSLVAEAKSANSTAVYLDAQPSKTRVSITTLSPSSSCWLDATGDGQWEVSCGPKIFAPLFRITRGADALEVLAIKEKKTQTIAIPATSTITLGSREASARTIEGASCPNDAKARGSDVELAQLSGTKDVVSITAAFPATQLAFLAAPSLVGCQAKIDDGVSKLSCNGGKLTCTLKPENASVLVMCGDTTPRTGRLLLPCGITPKLQAGPPRRIYEGD